MHKLETMQVRIEEPGGVLEPEADHPVEPYVRRPHEGHRQEERASSQEAESREEAGRSVGMEEIVGDCPYKRSAQVAEHREVRHQEQHDEQEPTFPSEAIDQEAAPEAVAEGWPNRAVRVDATCIRPKPSGKAINARGRSWVETITSNERSREEKGTV